MPIRKISCLYIYTNTTVTLDGKELYTIDLDLASLGLDSLDKVIIENNKVKSIKKGEVEYTGESTAKTEVKKVSAREVKQNATKYYGQSVNYTASGVTDAEDNSWRIFYSDGGYIYLISSDYMPNKYLSGLGFYTFPDKPYSICVQTNRNDLVRKLTTYNANFCDTSGYAEEAVLSPTIEMLCNSWNDIYPEEKIYCKYVKSGYNAAGYLVGLTENPTKYSEDISKKKGYKNTLYFPHSSSYNACNAYWLADFSAFKSDYLLYVAFNGNISWNSYTSGFGSRPVITLKPNIGLGELVDGKYELVDIRT